MTEIPNASGLTPSDWDEDALFDLDADWQAPGEPCSLERPCAECRAASADERSLEQRWTLAEDDVIDLGELWKAAHADDPRPAA